MTGFSNREARCLVEAMIAVIQQNAALLSDIDGAIGDGDHGINMNKGFTMAAERLTGRDWDFSEGATVLSEVLLGEIGGAMGPLYGSFFREMARTTRGSATIDAALFAAMLKRAGEAVSLTGEAQVGDKTLLDTLTPAVTAFEVATLRGAAFSPALTALTEAAEKGKDSTKDMVAKVGRSSRLGERSRGVLDAGAVSCWLLLRAMADASQKLLSA